MVQFAAKVVAAIALALLLLALIAAMQVRQAINEGALTKPWRCLDAKHYDDYRAGNVTQSRMDSWIAERVRDHHLNGQEVRAGTWHLRGMWALVGVKVGYWESSRRDMALRLFQISKLCPQDHVKYSQMKAAR